MPRRSLVIALLFALSGGIAACGGKDDPVQEAAATAASTPAATSTPACTEERNPYGTPPDGFKFDEADEAMRAKTVSSLGLNEADGEVDMRLVQRGGLTLGSIVGVPSADPSGYIASILSRAQASGAKTAKAPHFAMIDTPSGSAISLGVRGCRAVLITAPDPNAVKYLSAIVFG